MKTLLTLAVGFAALSSAKQIANAQSYAKDAAGNSYRLPAGWTAKAVTRGLRLYPPNVQQRESYVVVRSSNGFTKAKADVLRRQFGKLATSIAPYFKLTTEKWLKGPKGPVVVFFYSGKDSNGVTNQIRYYIGSLGSSAVVVQSVGQPSLLAKRKDDVIQIFLAAVAGRKSTATTTPKAVLPVTPEAKPVLGSRDSQVVGRWVRQVGASSSGGGYVASSTTYTFTFRSNGTCSLNIRTWVSASAGGSSAFSRPGRGTTYVGRWTASNGKIFIQYNNGTTLRNNYKVFLHFGKPVLKLYLPGGKPVYYKK